MPNLIFMMTPEASQLMSAEVFKLLAQELTEAIVDTLNFSSPQDVVVYELVVGRSLNASPLQILCLASAQPERLAKLATLSDELVNALVNCYEEYPACAKYLASIKDVEVWPVMPEGSWANVVLPLSSSPSS